MCGCTVGLAYGLFMFAAAVVVLLFRPPALPPTVFHPCHVTSVKKSRLELLPDETRLKSVPEDGCRDDGCPLARFGTGRLNTGTFRRRVIAGGKPEAGRLHYRVTVESLLLLLLLLSLQ